MSGPRGPVAANSLLTNLNAWAQQASNPNAAGLTGAVGSVLFRNGSFPTQPVEMYYKSTTQNKGWAKQNLVNLKVFNVQAYGAKGDGVTNDTAAIQAAINAAKANGGGEVYFPATSEFYSIVWFSPEQIGVLLISAATNITIRGDGFASKIKQTGSAGGGTTYMFEVTDQSTGIGFYDIYIDNANITDPSGTEQNHGIQLLAASTDGGDTTNIDIVRVYSGELNGDTIRVLGSTGVGPGQFVRNGRIHRCVLNTQTSRVGVSVQRCNSDFEVSDCWLQGNQGVHFEPTGGTLIDGWLITYNATEPQPGNTSTFDISYASHTLVGYNVLPNCNVTNFQLDHYNFIGNVIVYTAAVQGTVVEFEQSGSYHTVRANVIEYLFAPSTSASAVAYTIDNGGQPLYNLISDNIILAEAGDSACIAIDDTAGFTVAGNLLGLLSSGSFHEGAFGATGATVEISDINVVGNMALLTGSAAAQAPYFFSSEAGAGALCGPNLTAQYNYASGSMEYGVTFLPDNGPAPFPICGIGNMCVGTVSEQMFDQSTNSESITCEGNAAGFASQFTTIQLAAGPQSVSTCSPGSVCVNAAGAAYTAFSYKETGSDTSTGWLGVGECSISLGAASVGAATTALFFVPGGQDLATAQATEVQFAAPRPATIRNFRGQFTAGTGGGTNTYTLRKNGANTTITFGIANTATTGSDTTHTATVVAGDLISAEVTKASGPTAAQTQAQLTFGYA